MHPLTCMYAAPSFLFFFFFFTFFSFFLVTPFIVVALSHPKMCSMMSFNVDYSYAFPTEENHGNQGNVYTKSNSLLSLLPDWTLPTLLRSTLFAVLVLSLLNTFIIFAFLFSLPPRVV